MKKARKSQGFTIVEAIVAFSIIMVVAVIATPSVVRGLRTYRVGGAATSVANMIQRARYEAIKRNLTTSCRWTPRDNTIAIYVDLNGNLALDATEPRIELPPDVQFPAQGNAPSPGSMGYQNTTVPGNSIAFDPRGTVNFLGAAPTVYVVYVSLPSDASAGYRAISLTPTGKTKLWKATTGSNWYDR